MSGISIEQTLELWASSLRDAKARMRPLFTQDRVAASAGLFLDGLLCVFRAKSAGDSGMKSATDSDVISAIPI